MAGTHPGAEALRAEDVATSSFRNAIPNSKRYTKKNKWGVEDVAQAAYEGNLDLLETLLSTGDESNLFNGDLNMHVPAECGFATNLYTALQLAAVSGQAECIELLLEAKADPHMKEIPAVKEMGEKAQAILGYDVFQLCTVGPDERLQEISNCHPAMFIADLAGVEKLRRKREEAVTRAQVAAGPSVGQYAALTVAGVFTFEDGLKLLKFRSEALQAVESASAQAMLSVAGLDKPRLTQLCEEAAKKEGSGAVCEISSELFPTGFSVGGTEKSVLTLKELADKAGALQAKVLKPRCAFHTQLMKPAQEKLNKALDELLPKMSPPKMTVFMNATASPVRPGTNPKVIVELLKKELTSPILWEPSVRAMMKEGIFEFYEVGPMKQLKAMMKRIDPRVWGSTYSVEV